MEYSASRALTMAHAVKAVAPWETLDMSDHARALAILTVMQIVDSTDYMFTLECSADLTMNLQAGCEHVGNEFCDGSDLL